MDLNAPLEKNNLEKFECENHITLPLDLVELLCCFNGGEIFIPGTSIYGITCENNNALKHANRADLRNKFSIPKTYLIFASLNYGDFICINLNSPFDVIQWDHELDEKYCSWDGLEEWLNETIENYKDYEDGVE
jgi:hypothetical protein